jgi:very-short-patch-repair endonuclease
MPSTHKQAYAEHLLDNMTWPERILWSRLRHSQIGYSFQRQAIVRGYIVDFYCPEAQIVIELDGKVHDVAEKREADIRRDQFLTKNGERVLRFQNSDVKRGMSAVLIRIWDECFSRSPKNVKPLLFKGRGVKSRHAETLEMRALRAFQEDKRLKNHELNFSHRYWKTRRFPVRDDKKLRKVGPSL